MIYYFSGTGNSLYVARKIGEQTNDSVINIADCIKNNKYEFTLKGENLGFIFPAYFFGIPTIIRNFINKVKFDMKEIPYTYVIFTCESDIGSADVQIKKQLKRRNIKINYIEQIPMPNNYMLFYDLPDESYQLKKIERSNSKIENVIENIKRKISGGYKSNLVLRFITSISYPLYYFGRNTKNFYADEKCIGCGLCSNICPVEAISIIDKKPKWIKKKCVYCLACINRCPKSAIQIKGKTKGKRRYVNPILK